MSMSETYIIIRVRYKDWSRNSEYFLFNLDYLGVCTLYTPSRLILRILTSQKLAYLTPDPYTKIQANQCEDHHYLAIPIPIR